MVKMARTTGRDSILNRNAWALLTMALLFCGLCVCLSRVFPGLKLPVLAGLVFAGIVLVSIGGINILRTL